MILKISTQSNEDDLVSIVIVHYKNISVLLNCLISINSCVKNTNYEVIVVSNTNIPLKINFKKIKRLRIINNLKNLGFGYAINIGVSYSKGRYVFILNPDCIFNDNVVEKLLKILKKNKIIGIVAPVLLNKQSVEYMQIGIKELKPVRALIVLSFLSKIFLFKNIVDEYWGTNVKLYREKEVDIVAGSAFMIRRDLFFKLKGFDERFFLYFEEVDLCKRLKDIGYKIVIHPKIKIIHIWKATTPKSGWVKRVFVKSRRYYFRKHYGLVNSIIVETVLGISKKTIILASLIYVILVLLIVR